MVGLVSLSGPVAVSGAIVVRYVQYWGRIQGRPGHVYSAVETKQRFVRGGNHDMEQSVHESVARKRSTNTV